MSGELATLVADLSPYVTAAIGAYGGAVLSKAQEEAADTTVSWGRRLLQRIFGVRAEGEPLPEVLAEIVEDPDDADLQAALRVQIRRILAQDPTMTAEVHKLLSQIPPTGTTIRITASGERSVAAHTITGGVHTGDGHTSK
ncbi:hypothetical protein [Microbispora sp. H10670]|uniref:hypothetical protein n=1 Tax=Microbispora sp. H10670 TaxID=2729108 RepID=UPI00160359F1|nr:hypothetical protein [Microbispora sp. H10670]